MISNPVFQCSKLMKEGGEAGDGDGPLQHDKCHKIFILLRDYKNMSRMSFKILCNEFKKY